VWIFRESLRLLERIAIALLIAIVLAELRTLASGGELMHTFRISLIVIGAFLLAMGAMGPGSTYDRHLSAVGHYWAQRTGVADNAPPGPVLTAGAVFVFSGAAVLALGLFI
jgi:heme O synthase-like polyprenyltransferase